MGYEPTGVCQGCGGMGDRCICDVCDSLGIHNGGKPRERRRRHRERFKEVFGDA